MLDALLTLLQQHGESGRRLHAEEMHIPSLCFAEAKEHRSSTRIFFPQLVDWDNFPVCYKLTPKERAQIYGIMRETVIETVGPGEAGHWQATYEAELARASKGGSNKPEKSGRLIPHNKVPAFGRHLLQRIQRLPWGKGAYFFLELRGTRGGAQHRPQNHRDKLDEYLSCINVDAIDKEKFWIDVGHEIQASGHVLWWRRDAHVGLLAAVLGMERNDAVQLTNSKHFYRDDACQLTEAAGFRLTLPKKTQEDLGVMYIQAYCTEKMVVYHPGNHTIHLDYIYLLRPGLKEILHYSQMMEDIHEPSEKQKVAGNARLEVRVCLSKLRQEAGYLPLNNGQMRQALYQFPSKEWW